MTKAIEAFQNYLKSKGLKLTRTRRIIFEEIISAGKIHPDAYNLYESLKKKGHQVSLATIYRTLSLLVKSGLVSEINFGEDHAHYEADIHKEGHGHLICLSCGKVREFSHDEIRAILERIGKQMKFKTDRFTVQVFGYCSSCRKK